MFLLLPLLIIPTSVVFARNYCATVSPEQAAGASGYFVAKIVNQTAQYMFSLDLTNFDAGVCDLSQGLTYHFHSYWKNASVTSSANSYCGGSYCGGHFDPNLACSPFSQDIGSYCVALGRTATSTPPYTYSCNSSNYLNEKYPLCETGDLSGKFGRVLPSSNGRVFQQSSILDIFPPYDASFKTSTVITKPWQSIVFHCPASNARLVCAEFVLSEECGDSIRSDSDDKNEWSISEWDTLTKILLSAAVVLVVGGMVAAFIVLRKPASSDDSAHNGLL
jgi:hypothetical protein